MSSKKSKLKVTVHAAVDWSREIKSFFYMILEDYCIRFATSVIDEKRHVQICIIEYDESSASHGVTIQVEDSGKILVQVRDPFLNDWEPNVFTMQYFVSVMAHEFVHVCQYLTQREGLVLPELAYNKEDEAEQYYFDPMEVEARLLQDFYMYTYGQGLLL